MMKNQLSYIYAAAILLMATPVGAQGPVQCTSGTNETMVGNFISMLAS